MANLFLGFIMDIIINGGTAIAAAMGATKSVEMPPWPVVTFALLVATVQAARRWQSKTGPDPSKPEAPIRTPEQLAAQGKAREDAITAVVERVLKAKLPPPVAPVTPSRPATAPSATPVFVPEPPPVVAAPPVVPESTRVPRERDLPGGTS